MRRLEDAKIEELWAAWQKTQSVSAVARTCRVSPVTVRRYRDENDWPGRMRAISQKVQKKADETIAEKRARWAKQGKALQKIGLTKFFDAKGNLKVDLIKKLSVRDAIYAIATGVEMEREALGSALDNMVEKYKPLVIQLVGGSNGDGKKVKQIESAVVESGNDAEKK